ncbi:MAG TPA: hypothetical protein VKP60_13395, partial [Magnetospirillaceae bacterium]|nr:hypothetical protein [Magnetospirillaceae bacterium]
MRLFRHFAELPAAVRGGVVALGNFDGVHLGHQAVIGRALDLAKRLGAPAGVMTFEPHPRSVFTPDQPPFRLTPFRIKARLIEALSVDFLLMQHFDKAFAAHSAEDFIEEVLIKGLGVRAVVVGYDFCFGKGRAGSVEMLRGRPEFQTVSVDAQSGPDGQSYRIVYVAEDAANVQRGKYLADNSGKLRFLIDPGIAGGFPYRLEKASLPNAHLAIPENAPHELGLDHQPYSVVDVEARQGEVAPGRYLVAADGSIAYSESVVKKFPAPQAQLFRLIIDGTLGGT